MCHTGTTGETAKWIVQDAKIHFTSSTSARDFLEQLGVQRHRLEKQHSEISQTGHHGVMAAMKKRYSQARVILKSKPIAVRASHGINHLHTKSFVSLLF